MVPIARSMLAQVAFAAAAAAQCPFHETQTLVANDGAPLDFFGFSIAASGDVAVVGSIQNDAAAYHAGAAYVFRRSGTTWSQSQKLIASDAHLGDDFGWSVAASGDLLVVSAPFKYDSIQNRYGAAYVFRWNGASFLEEQELTIDSGGKNVGFALAVGVDGDVVVVGAPEESPGRIGALGAAYVFRHSASGWSLEQRLAESSDGPPLGLGAAVAASGNRLAIGAPSYGAHGSSIGAVYVYQFNGASWALEQRLLANDGSTGDVLGAAVALRGTRVLAGARYDATPEYARGSAYLFHFDGAQWSQEQKLVAPDGAQADFFGASVALDEEVAVVGAPAHLSATGAAYGWRFVGSGWVLEEELLASAGVSGDGLGNGVAVTSHAALASAPGSKGSTGSALVFDVPPLALDLEPDPVSIGAAETIRSCGGPPTNPLALYVLAVNGAPFVQLVAPGTFDALGSFVLSGSVPNDPAFSGSSVTFDCFALDAARHVVASNVATLSIQ